MVLKLSLSPKEKVVIMKSISTEYADFIVRTQFEDLGAEVLQQAKKLILDLGYPVLSLSVILFALLLGGGLGSLYSQRWPLPRLPRLMSLAVVLALLWGLALLGSSGMVGAGGLEPGGSSPRSRHGQDRVVVRQ